MAVKLMHEDDIYMGMFDLPSSTTKPNRKKKKRIIEKEIGEKFSAFSWKTLAHRWRSGEDDSARLFGSLGFEIIRLGHNRKATRSRFKRRTAPLLVRRGADQCRERALHPLALHRSDPNKRIGHRRSPRIQPIGRRGDGMLRGESLVEAAAEGSGMVRRRAHAGLPRRSGGGDRSTLGGDLVERAGARGPDEVDAGRGGGSVGGEVAAARGEGGSRRDGESCSGGRGEGGIDAGWGGEPARIPGTGEETTRRRERTRKVTRPVEAPSVAPIS
ncbi:hypothetical protein HPP92_020082 [Vanilla planifolia]|uniref:Uncharacterized protein n=1 Tax=Vanilla planifolia TaxID=51239 RepID=A0A835Q7R7_VANPL|nr:hypothetical protein HPP92_020082 [Vanilla planifolia]